MSPEQARGLDLDGRSDLFSLDLVLYEMITGRSPLEGNSMADLLVALMQGEPSPLTSHTPDVPDELQRIITKLLRKNADEGYQSARDLLVDLKALRTVTSSGDPAFDGGTLKQGLVLKFVQTPFLRIFPQEGVLTTLALMERKPDMLHAFHSIGITEAHKDYARLLE